jgi:hypothetical protein
MDERPRSERSYPFGRGRQGRGRRPPRDMADCCLTFIEARGLEALRQIKPAGAIGVLWKSARSAATTITILLLANVVVSTVEGSIPVKVVLNSLLA